jgi:hypothetical protein
MMVAGARKNAAAAVLAALAFARLAFGQAPAPSPAFKSVSDSSNKKIGMVISTLKDILQSVTNEETEETGMYNKYMTWCTSETAGITTDLSETKTELQDTKVLSQQQIGDIDSLTLFVKKNEKETEETQDAVAQAVSLRTGENDKYTEELDLNTQSIRQIEQAIKHVGKVQSQGGFLQNGVMKKLAMNQPGESSYVYGIMKGLKDKLAKSRVDMKEKEADAVTMHDSFITTKKQSLKSLNDATLAKKIEVSETTAKESGTKRKIDKLTQEIEDLQKKSTKTTETCDQTKDDWKLREADRTKEKAALNEAVRYLTETSLEQLSLVQESIEDKSTDDDAVVFAPSLLQDASESKLSSNAFYAAAGAELMGEDDEIEAHSRKDSFSGVKEVVAKLISTHQETQKEEKTELKYCEEEIATKEDQQETLTDDTAAVQANVDKKEAEVIDLADEVTAKEAEIVQIANSLAAAGNIRKQQKTLFTSSSKDRTLALKVLNQAVSVLNGFYNKANFMQSHKAAAMEARSSQAPTPPSFGKSKNTAGFGAVSMVQNIADDIRKEQKDAALEEQKAADVYAKLHDDSATDTDNLRKDITDSVMTKAKMGVQINTLKETLVQKNDDMTAVVSQLAALHSKCDELTKNYDERTKARTFEVNQLRDVTDILSGSSIAARTGLMQDDSEPDA